MLTGQMMSKQLLKDCQTAKQGYEFSLISYVFAEGKSVGYLLHIHCKVSGKHILIAKALTIQLHSIE